jgi:hypothetical protein
VSNSTFQMSNFVPVDGPLVMMGETTVSFSFSSAYATSILVELWSEEDSGASYLQNQSTVTDGQNEPSLVFSDFPLEMDLHYKITITGESGAENTVHVSIDW